MKELGIITPVQRFIRLLKVERKDLYSIYLFAIFNGLINLSLPLGIQSIINLIGGGVVSTSWIILVIVVIVGVAMSGVLQVFQLGVNENLQQRIFAKSAFDFAYRIPKFKLESVNQYYVPELVMRFFETVSIQKGLSKILVDFSTASLQVIFGLLLLSIYHPFFIVYSILFVVIVFLIVRLTGRRGMETSIKESKYKYEVVHWLVDIARTMESFKMAGNTELNLEKTNKNVKGYLSSRQQHFKVLKFQYYNLIVFKVLVTAGLLLIGGLLVIDQQMNIGQFVAAEIIIILLISSVEKLLYSMDTIYDVLTALEKIGAITDLPLEKLGGQELPVTPEYIGGMDVSINQFKYKFLGEIDYSIKELNLSIKPGEKICIVGANGSGKSLLIHILAGLYQSFEGSLVFNGVPLANLDLNSLRDKIGSSFSKEDIIQGTILENITMGKPNVDFNSVLRATEIVGLKDFILSLPEGFETYLHPEGMNLPKSRILKIKLARCIICNPLLILIEDHINLLENEPRNKVLEHLTNQQSKATVLVISNDVEVACKFNRVLCMEEGSLVFDGSYEESTRTNWFDKLMKK